MKKIVIATLLLAFTQNVKSQDVKLKLNLESAIEVLSFLDMPSKRSPEYLLNFEGIKNQINHDGNFDKLITEENFLSEIKSDNSTTDAFGFKQIRKEKETIKNTLVDFKKNELKYSKLIEDKIKSYCLNIVDSKPFEIIVVIGGNSDGFAVDENTFCVELQFYGDDIEGLINLISHEVYHLIQKRTFNENAVIEKMSQKDMFSYMMLHQVYKEGSATLVGSPLAIKNPKKFSSDYIAKFERNFKRKVQNFQLFKTLLTTINTQEKFDPQALYLKGFSGENDSPMYFVGFEICQELEKKYGKYYIKKYLEMSPTFFFLDYINLYKLDKNIKCVFSPEIEEYIKQLHTKYLAIH